MRGRTYDFLQFNCVQSDVHEELKENFLFKKITQSVHRPKELPALQEIARMTDRQSTAGRTRVATLRDVISHA